MFVDRRVVVEIEADRIFGLPRDVVLGRVRPPFVEGTMVASAFDLVVEPQTEAGAAQSIGPDFGVLTVAPHLTPVPLLGQMRGHGRMAPRESVLAVADHLEGLIPLRVARDISV